MAILLVLVGVILVGAVAQLIFNNRSDSLDDSGSAPAVTASVDLRAAAPSSDGITNRRFVV